MLSSCSCLFHQSLLVQIDFTKSYYEQLVVITFFIILHHLQIMCNEQRTTGKVRITILGFTPLLLTSTTRSRTGARIDSRHQDKADYMAGTKTKQAPRQGRLHDRHQDKADKTRHQDKAGYMGRHQDKAGYMAVTKTRLTEASSCAVLTTRRSYN